MQRALPLVPPFVLVVPMRVAVDDTRLPADLCGDVLGDLRGALDALLAGKGQS